MTKSGIISIIVSAFVVVVCGSSIKILTQKLNTAQAETKAAKLEIERLNGVVKDFADYQDRQKIVETEHIENIIDHENEMVEKIRIVENDPDSIDWLDQRLPMCVQEQYSTGNRDNTRSQQAPINTIEEVRKASGVYNGD